MLNKTEIEGLIARVALGDRAAFSNLYDATSAKLLGVCLRILKERSAAEDALQDTFIKIWKNAKRFTASNLSPMTWMITVARNTSIDRIRSDRQVLDIDDFADLVAITETTPEQLAVASSEARRIAACLDELDTQRASAVKAAYLNGNSYKELASRFDVPLNTMRTWLRRALISLRECMQR